MHIRKFFRDRDANLRAKTEGIAMTLGQFAIFIDSMEHIESRFRAMEEGLSINSYDRFVGPWKFTVNVFGYINISKYYYDSATDQLLPSNKWFSFPLNFYRPLAREIFNLLKHFPNLKERRPCYETVHSKTEKCNVCDPFEKFRVKPKPDEAICHITGLNKSITI